jgi:hypothetical protein
MTKGKPPWRINARFIAGNLILLAEAPVLSRVHFLSL